MDLIGLPWSRRYAALRYACAIFGKPCQFAFATLFCYEDFRAPKDDGWI
jgi:hypothetical protein